MIPFKPCLVPVYYTASIAIISWTAAAALDRQQTTRRWWRLHKLLATSQEEGEQDKPPLISPPLQTSLLDEAEIVAHDTNLGINFARGIHEIQSRRVRLRRREIPDADGRAGGEEDDGRGGDSMAPPPLSAFITAASIVDRRPQTRRNLGQKDLTAKAPRAPS